MERKPIKLKNEIRDMSIEEVYEQFKNLIYKQCQSWLGMYEFDDLQQVAFIGMQKAYKTYDVKKDVLFLTYASTAISNELKIYHRKNKKHLDTFSLNKTFSFKDDEMEYIDTIADNVNYEEIAFNNIECENLIKALEKLDPEERKLIEDLGLKSKTQREVSERLNLSQSRISRKYKITIEKIRKIMEGEQIMPVSKITRSELIREVRAHGTGKAATKLIAEKYGLSPGTIRSYYDTMDVRQESKNYKGSKKTIEVSKEIAVKKDEPEVEVRSILQEVKVYKGAVGEYEIHDTNVNLKHNNELIVLEKSNIDNLILELQELRKVI